MNKKIMTLRSKTQNLGSLNHLHFVFIGNEQIILQKRAGVVSMPLTDLNGSNKTNEQTIKKRQEQGYLTYSGPISIHKKIL